MIYCGLTRSMRIYLFAQKFCYKILDEGLKKARLGEAEIALGRKETSQVTLKDQWPRDITGP